MKAKKKARAISEKRRSKRSSNPFGLSADRRRSSLSSPSTSPETANSEPSPAPPSDTKACSPASLKDSVQTQQLKADDEPSNDHERSPGPPPYAAHAEPQSSYSAQVSINQKIDEARPYTFGQKRAKKDRQLALYSAADVRRLHEGHTSGVLATSLFPSPSLRRRPGQVSLLVPSDIPSIFDEGRAPSAIPSPRVFRSSVSSNKENISEGLDRAYHRFAASVQLQGLKPISLPMPAFTAQSNVRSVLATSTAPNLRPISYPPSRYQSELSSNAAQGNTFENFCEGIKLSARGPPPALTPRSTLRPKNWITVRGVAVSALPSLTPQGAKPVTLATPSRPLEAIGKREEAAGPRVPRTRALHSPAPKMCMGLGLELHRDSVPLVLSQIGELASKRGSGSASDSDGTLESSDDARSGEDGGKNGVVEVQKERVTVFERGVWPTRIGGY